jgi:hypothetical protein
MQVLGFMQSNSMLCTDAAVSFCDFFENVFIMPFHILLIRDDINVDIAITDVTVSENFLT